MFQHTLHTTPYLSQCLHLVVSGWIAHIISFRLIFSSIYRDTSWDYRVLQGSQPFVWTSPSECSVVDKIISIEKKKRLRLYICKMYFVIIFFILPSFHLPPRTTFELDIERNQRFYTWRTKHMTVTKMENGQDTISEYITEKNEARNREPYARIRVIFDFWSESSLSSPRLLLSLHVTWHQMRWDTRVDRKTGWPLSIFSRKKKQKVLTASCFFLRF